MNKKKYNLEKQTEYNINWMLKDKNKGRQHPIVEELRQQIGRKSTIGRMIKKREERIQKTEDEIKLAIKKRVLLINMESESEANLINKISKKMSRTTSVGIRLNPNITGKTNKKISTGGKHNKFGLGYNDCINLCKKISNLRNLKLDGLSVHIGSQITNIKPFKQVLAMLNKIIVKTKINFKFIDLGGGMGISYSNKEKKLDLNQYAKLVNKFVKNKKTQIIFEPGRFIVGNTSVLISKVIYIKKVTIKILLS